MDPEIWSIGPLHFRWYGILWGLSFVIGYQITKWVFVREKEELTWLDSLLTILAICSILGARLGHTLFYNLPYYLENPAEIFMFWKGGMASHGGFIGMTVAFWLFSKYVSKRSIFWVSDRIVMSTAIAAGLIRIGNFINQEIVGHVTDLPWGVKFVLYERKHFPLVPESLMQARHPAQIYEALCYFAIAGLLFFFYKKGWAKEFKGRLTGLFLVLTFSARFLIEFVKENQEAFEEGLALNMGQILSIPIVLFGLYLVFGKRNGK